MFVLHMIFCASLAGLTDCATLNTSKPFPPPAPTLRPLPPAWCEAELDELFLPPSRATINSYLLAVYKRALLSPTSKKGAGIVRVNPAA